MLRNLSKSAGALAAAATVSFAALAFGTAGEAEAQTRVTLKAAASGSSYYVMMVQLGQMLENASDGDILATIEESQGSVQNVKEARRRQGAYMFTSPPSLIAQAQEAAGPFEGEEDGYDRIRTLLPVPFITIHFVVRDDLDIETVQDLAGHSFIAGATGTFCAGRTSAILDILGIGEAVDQVETELSGAANAVRNRQVDGFATCSAHPTPQLSELGSTTDIRILPFTDEERAQIIEADPLSGEITIEAGTYPNQDEAIPTIAVPVGFHTTTDMDEETAYLVVRSFWENKERLVGDNPWWQAMEPELISQVALTLHPGALRYYEEIGVEIPDRLK